VAALVPIIKTATGAGTRPALTSARHSAKMIGDRMKKIMLLMLFSVLSTYVFADITIVQKIATGPMMGQPGKDMTVTQYYKGSKSRVDSGPQAYAVIDLQAGKMYTVDKTKKEVVVMSREMIHKTMEMGMMMMGGSNFTVNKTGKSDTITGYKCEQYTVVGKSINVVAWVSQDVNVKELEPFRSFAQDFIGKALAGLPGIAIKSESKFTLMGQEISGSSQVLSISKDSVPDSLFVVPADYRVKEMAMPKIPSMQH
jgi:Domain of unknown function (DUF4412)